MRTEELHVQRIKRELDDMLQKNTLNKKRLMELLEKLSSISVDTELLQRTQVGRTVNNVRKSYSSSRDINQRAVKLIKQWKTVVKNEHGRRKSVSSNCSDEGRKTPGYGGGELQISSPESSTMIDGNDHDQYSPVDNSIGDDDHAYFNGSKNQDDGPRPAKIGRSNSTSSSASSNNTSDSNGAKDNTRAKSVELLRQSLLSGDQPPPKQHPRGKTSLDLAREIERHIFEEFGNAEDRHYKSRVRSRVLNFRDKKNPMLRNRVLTGELSTIRVAKMSVEEMANEELKQLRRSLEEESIRNREIAEDAASARTDAYACDQCSGRDAYYAVTQEKAKGEGPDDLVATTQLVCNRCGHRWRVV